MAKVDEAKVKELETKQAELEKVRQDLKTNTEKAKTLREEIAVLEGKSTKMIPYDYEVKEGVLRDLCEKHKVINGITDLFSRALIIKHAETGEVIKLENITNRVRKQGEDAIKEYCIIEERSPRILYIKRMKSKISRDAKKKYNVKNDDALLEEEILRTKKEYELLEAKAKIEKLKNGNGENGNGN